MYCLWEVDGHDVIEDSGPRRLDVCLCRETARASRELLAGHHPQADSDGTALSALDREPFVPVSVGDAGVPEQRRCGDNRRESCDGDGNERFTIKGGERR